MAQLETVSLAQLTPMTVLLVWTSNSLYRFVVNEGTSVYVQGGALFPEPTAAFLDGASVEGRGYLKVGWIGVGCVMEIRTGLRRIVTSPVRAISTEQQNPALVH